MTHEKYQGGRHVVWSASALNTALRCPRQYYLQYVEGLQTELPGKPLVFGSAFHKYQELVQTMSPEHALAEACDVIQQDDDLYNAANLRRLVEGYEAHHANDLLEVEETEAKWHLEAPFKVDGNEITFMGFFDAIAQWRGEKYVVDYKTTKLILQESFYTKAKNGTQMLLYGHAAPILHGTSNLMLDYARMLKTKVEYDRVPFRPDPDKTDEFLENTRAVIENVFRWQDAKSYPKHITQCDTCSFRQLCSFSHQPDTYSRIKEGNFTRRAL